MKAITYSNYGPPEVLEVREVDTPVPGDNEVLRRVRAAEATKSDCEMRSFHFAVKWFWLPLRRANLEPGDRVLVNGAGGSIGLHAVQIAKALCAHVTAVDAGRKEALIRSMGAHDFVDYEKEDFSARGDKWQAMLDMVPGSSCHACVGALEPGGRYLSGNPRLSVMLRSFLTTWFTDKSASCAFAREKNSRRSGR